MKAAKYIHIAMASVPLIWFVTFLLQLVAGIIHFKTIPAEYVQSDPCSLGLCWLNLISGILLFCTIFMIPAWIVVGLIIWAIDKKLPDKLSSILFFTGVTGFFLFKYFFPEVFGWVLD